MGVVGTVVGGAIGDVFVAAGRWAADGAVWLLGQVGHALTATTSVGLGAGWFTTHEHVMSLLAATVVLPMACCTVILAVFRQDASLLTRTFLVHLPLSLLLTGVAVELVRMALAVTDTLSAQVLAAGGVDTEHLLAPVATALAVTGPLSAGVVPAFVVFVGGLLVALVALGLWLELVVRAAAVTAATLFLPLALAGLVWPAVSHWCRRLAETIAALVLSKLVVAAVLSLAAGALAGGFADLAHDPSGGFAAVVAGVALLFVATSAPFVLLHLVPMVEAGAIAHLQSASARLRSTAMAPARSYAVDLAGRAGQAATHAMSAAAATAGPVAPSGGVAGTSVPMLRGITPSEAFAQTGLHFPDPSDEQWPD